MPTLTIQLPGQPSVSHVLKDDTVTIGRMKGNTIVIEDNSISLMHARITRKGGEFFLKDLNSTNGTMVNGQPVIEARLRDQDRVRFAEVSTQFLTENEPIAATAASASSVASPSAAPKDSAPPRAKPEVRAGRPRRVVAIALISVAIISGWGLVAWKLTSGTKESANVPAVAAESKQTRAVASASERTPKPEIKTKPASESLPAETRNPAPSPEMVEIINKLKSGDVTERRQAASALHDAGEDAKDAVPALKEALKDSDAEVQMWAALALVNTQTYDKTVIAILVRSLKNDNTVLRQVACLSLGLIQYQAADRDTVIPALAEAATNDASDDVRQAAKSALNIVSVSR